MKRCVSITFDVDLKEIFDGNEDTPREAIEYAKACIDGKAEWPTRITISCQGTTEWANRPAEKP